MAINPSNFTIVITTKNRRDDLAFTLRKICHLIESGVECIICDDGSSDDTAAFLQMEYPVIKLIQNKKSRGLILSRNRLLHMVTTEYAISLDDDAHFITENPLESIIKHFEMNPTCGLIALRIFWGLDSPANIVSNEETLRVKGFVGCGHVWRMKAWQKIPNYPEWFVFYGEEDFASFQLFKKGWEVHYVPAILVNHRVDLKARKNDKEYQLRLRRSLRSGWYLYILFYPWYEIPRRFAYTLWIQIKNKAFKGDWKATLAIMQAMGDLVINLPRLLYHSNRLSAAEYNSYSKLSETKLYWKPEKIIKKLYLDINRKL
ncbi:MAG: glycosyltransferase [Candidatus Magasanikbacteria bacterium]|nr:glycosyltransferase [Candidatus Magasanikbacteria bacterium]